MEFDTDAKTASRGPYLVTFDPCPKSEIEYDARVEA